VLLEFESCHWFKSQRKSAFRPMQSLLDFHQGLQGPHSCRSRTF
jgi:hypothetical protein